MALDIQSYLEKPATYFGRPRTEIEPVLPPSCKRVLEIGCGSGGTMGWLKQIRQIDLCVGVDLMPEAVEQARLVFDEAFSCNIETDDLPVGPFDLILALDVLEHLADPWAIVKRLDALLAPGGSIVVSLPHVGHWTVSLPLLTRGRWDYQIEGLLDRTHLRFFSRQTAIEMMTSSGLVLECIHAERQYPLWIDTIRSSRVGWYIKRIVGELLPSHALVFWHFIRVQKPPLSTVG